MRPVTCKCGELKTFGTIFPPYIACQKCRTYPGNPYRQPIGSKRPDQGTGEPFMLKNADRVEGIPIIRLSSIVLKAK